MDSEAKRCVTMSEFYEEMVMQFVPDELDNAMVAQANLNNKRQC